MSGSVFLTKNRPKGGGTSSNLVAWKLEAMVNAADLGPTLSKRKAITVLTP